MSTQLPSQPADSHQHRAYDLADSPGAISPVVGGAISIIPDESPEWRNVVTAAGGTAVPLGSDTTGLIWLGKRPVEELISIVELNPQLGFIQLPWAGVERFISVIDIVKNRPASSRAVITSAKGSYAEPVAEHALALIFSALRGFVAKAREPQWQARATGHSLFGKRVTILGAGGIAQALISLLEPFRVEITLVRRQTRPHHFQVSVDTVENLDHILSRTDVLVLAIPATPETKNLISDKQLSLLPANAAVVNVGRGQVLDTDALLRALENGSLSGAGLDVTEPEPLPSGHPLWSNPKCFITSHSADTPEMVQPLLMDRVRVNITAFLSGQPLVGVVDPDSGY